MTSTTPPAAANDEFVESAELTALIQAIKFAFPEFGYKRVHQQIGTHGGKYAKVPLKRVKKYMQNMGLHQAREPTAPAQATAISNAKRNAKGNEGETKTKDKDTIQLMTVGGESKSQQPTQEDQSSNTSALDSEDDDKWLPVKLDEPASKMTKFPYQAVIRMTHNEEGDAHGAMGEIYKIQVAMGVDGQLSTTDPMLVYNKARNRKTFLHPDSPAYLPVNDLVKSKGIVGAVGGAKAYFWGRFRQQGENKLIYINTKSLAPSQQW